MRTIRQLTTILPVALMLTGIGAAQSTPPAVNGSQAKHPHGTAGRLHAGQLCAYCPYILDFER